MMTGDQIEDIRSKRGAKAAPSALAGVSHVRPDPLPVLMRDAEVISLKEAVFRSGKSEKTIARWCRQDGIGRRPSPAAPWEISAIALEAKRYGDCEAIEDLRNGNFSSRRVKRYVDHLGLDV